MDSLTHTALRWSGNLHYHHHSSFTTTKYPTNDSLEARITDSTLSILNHDDEEDDHHQQQQEEEERLHHHPLLLLPRTSHPTPPPSSSSSVNNDDTKEHCSNTTTTTSSSPPLSLPVRIPRLSIARILAEAELMEKQQQQQSKTIIRHPPAIAATGLPQPEYWITYGHSPDTLTSIKHTNSIVTRRLTSLANTHPSTAINQALKQHNLRLANAREASRVKKAAEEAAAVRENERVSQRLKAVKASSDVERQGLKKEYARQREIFMRLCRMPQRPVAMA